MQRVNIYKFAKSLASSLLFGACMVVAVVAVFYERERRETWGGGYSTAGPFGK